MLSSKMVPRPPDGGRPTVLRAPRVDHIDYEVSDCTIGVEARLHEMVTPESWKRFFEDVEEEDFNTDVDNILFGELWLPVKVGIIDRRTNHFLLFLDAERFSKIDVRYAQIGEVRLPVIPCLQEGDSSNYN